MMNSPETPSSDPLPRRTRIKLCGLSQPADVACAVELGADAIGLVFYPPARVRWILPGRANWCATCRRLLPW